MHPLTSVRGEGYRFSSRTWRGLQSYTGSGWSVCNASLNIGPKNKIYLARGATCNPIWGAGGRCAMHPQTSVRGEGYRFSSRMWRGLQSYTGSGWSVCNASLNIGVLVILVQLPYLSSRYYSNRNNHASFWLVTFLRHCPPEVKTIYHFRLIKGLRIFFFYTSVAKIVRPIAAADIAQTSCQVGGRRGILDDAQGACALRGLGVGPGPTARHVGLELNVTLLNPERVLMCCCYHVCLCAVRMPARLWPQLRGITNVSRR